MQEPFILFQVAGTTYALPSAQVLQVEMLSEVTRVPNAPPFVDGVVYVRGRVVPVVDLRTRFGFERRPYDIKTRLLVVELGTRWVGLVTDSARDFILLDSDDIQPPPTDALSLQAAYVVGVFVRQENLLLVLDIRRLLDADEQQSLAEVPQAANEAPA
ncbi:MAG: chemotaxis protein CheW [Anaerolineales bacterium]